MRMAPRLPVTVTDLMSMPPIEVAVADAGAVPDDRAMLLMVMMMGSGAMAVVTLLTLMLPVTMPMVPLGNSGGGRRDEQSGRA